MDTVAKCIACGKEFKTWKCYEKRGGNKYCSQECYSSSIRKNKIIDFDGDVFYTNAGGYFYSAKTKRFLHRAVWEKNNCKIPDGHIIHHIDGNRDNNSLENLKLLGKKEHSRLHYGNGEGLGSFRHKKKICQIDGCTDYVKGRGLCVNHYRRLVVYIEGILQNKSPRKRSKKVMDEIIEAGDIYLKTPSRFKIKRDGYSFIDAVKQLRG